jgi:hypothetical protein
MAKTCCALVLWDLECLHVLRCRREKRLLLGAGPKWVNWLQSGKRSTLTGADRLIARR